MKSEPVKLDRRTARALTRPERRRRRGNDRGSVALEFGLVIPILVLLLVGVIEFSWNFYAQANVSASAREGAREYAINQSVAAAEDQAVLASKLPGLTTAHVSVKPTSCTPGDMNATVEIHYMYGSLTGFFGDFFHVKGTGVMRCGG